LCHGGDFRIYARVLHVLRIARFVVIMPAGGRIRGEEVSS
jgi:hypothetical protein